MGDLVKAYLTVEEKSEIAELIVRELRRRAQELGLDEKDIWAAVDASNVILEEFKHGDVDGVFIPEEESKRKFSLIKMNFTRERPSRTEVIAHELARFLMRYWVSSEAYGTDAVICTNQDNRAVRQEIAVMVARRY